MKKLLVGLILFAVGMVPAFAAYQYDINSDGIGINENLSLVIHVTGNDLFKNFDQFGYTVQNADGTTRSETFNLADVNGKQFEFGNFTAGEKVGFFVVKNGVVTTDFELSGHSDAQSLLSFYTASGKVYTSFRIQVAAGEYTGKTDGNAPSGQPLPGVLAAVLIGGGAIGAMRLRRRRRG